MDPFTVFDGAAAWREYIFARPEFYLAGSGLVLGLALAVLTWKKPATPKKREKLRTRKGWVVPLLLSFSLGFLIWGFYRLGAQSLDLGQLLGLPCTAALSFLAFRFPRIIGIPLGAATLAAVLSGLFFLSHWHPLRPGTPLAAARSMPEGNWELMKAGGTSLVPEDLFPREIWILETPGYLALSGASRWISWRNPLSGGLGEVFHGFAQGLNWERKTALPLPPNPREFYPSKLELSTDGTPLWQPGI